MLCGCTTRLTALSSYIFRNQLTLCYVGRPAQNNIMSVYSKFYRKRIFSMHSENQTFTWKLADILQMGTWPKRPARNFPLVTWKLIPARMFICIRDRPSTCVLACANTNRVRIKSYPWIFFRIFLAITWHRDENLSVLTRQQRLHNQ